MLPVPAPRSSSRGRARQTIRQTPRQRDAACRMIERFAQREPVGGEALGHSASAWANSRACVCQSGSVCPTCHAASAISRRSPVPKISRRSAFDRLM